MAENILYDKLSVCYHYIRKITDFVPRVAIVLGSGLGDFADLIDPEMEIFYDDIPDFPVSTVPGHSGKFILGHIEDVPVICMKGRVHYYEGYDISDVVLPIRLMKMLGADILLLTNAAGGVNYSFKIGDIMMIKDHISLFVPNPLIGENIEALGTRFPDMSNIYDEDLQQLIRQVAEEKHIPLQEGTYVQLTGPSYETPAEIRALRTLGCDAVGMSTAVEAIAANHSGMRIAGISFISNMASGISDTPLNHEEVQEMANRVAAKFQTLMLEIVKRL